MPSHSRNANEHVVVGDFRAARANRLANTCGCLAFAVGSLLAIPPAVAADDADLAKQLSNPVAALISVPFQYNYDGDIGTDRQGRKNYINFQPVVPITLNSEWNLISRTILPIIDQQNVTAGGAHQFGIGDITQSLFFSPAKPTASGRHLGRGARVSPAHR